MSIDAYFYSFDATGVEGVDKILRAVASAGASFHHTEDWTDKIEWLEGKSYIDLIQEAANELAASIKQEHP